MANGRGRFRRGPSFDDRATGKFSGSPAGYSRDTGPSFSDVATGKFSGSPPGYGYTPSQRQPGFGIANTRVAQQAGLGDRIGNVARNVANRIKPTNYYPGMMWDSIANNQAQHRYLDEVYGKGKGAAQWDQAINQFYDRGLYSPGSDEPLKSAIGMSFGDIEPGGGGTLGGVSFGQANKYLNAAGVTDQALQKYIREGKSDAWLRNEAGSSTREQQDFDTALSFIKNAKSTANLARATAAAGMENEMYGGRPLEGPSFDDAATRVRSYPEDVYADFRSGIEQAGGPPRSYPPDVTEDITADIAGTPPGGYLDAANLISNQVGPGPWNEFDPYNTSMVPANVGKRGKSTLEEKQVFNDLYDFDTLRNIPFNVPQSYWNPDQMGYLGVSEEDERFGAEPGTGAYDFVKDGRSGTGFYTNRIGDVIPNRRLPNVSPGISISTDGERFRKSDMRLKEDIQLVGKSPSDVNIYSFKYKGEPGKYEGVMAQEVPWASSVGEDGFLRVDYSKVDVYFKPIG